jgi:hypothetical protein
MQHLSSHFLKGAFSSTGVLHQVKIKVRDILHSLFVILLALLDIELTKRDSLGH